LNRQAGFGYRVSSPLPLGVEIEEHEGWSRSWI